MNCPPPVLDSARVMKYAVVTESVTFTDRIKLNVVGEWLGKVPCLAVARNVAAPQDVLLFLCGEDWEVKGVIVASSVDEALEKAECGYVGLRSNWQDHPSTDEEVARFLEAEYGVDPSTEWWKLFCSFCGKEYSEVSGMFQGIRATICHECVKYMAEELGNTSGDG